MHSIHSIHSMHMQVPYSARVISGAPPRSNDSFQYELYLIGPCFLLGLLCTEAPPPCARWLSWKLWFNGFMLWVILLFLNFHWNMWQNVARCGNLYGECGNKCPRWKQSDYGKPYGICVKTIKHYLSWPRLEAGELCPTPRVMTWILYQLVCCPYFHGNALHVRRGSFTIWSIRKVLNLNNLEPWARKHHIVKDTSACAPPWKASPDSQSKSGEDRSEGRSFQRTNGRPLNFSTPVFLLARFSYSDRARLEAGTLYMGIWLQFHRE